MTAKNVYISGPMRGYDGYNFPAFFEAEETVRLIFPDAHICNPAREDVERFSLKSMLRGDPSGLAAGRFLQNGLFTVNSLREALGHDLDYICEKCDLVVALPGWENSKGARCEVATAQALGIPVISYPAASWDAESPVVSPAAASVGEDTDEAVPGPESGAQGSEGTVHVNPEGGVWSPWTETQVFEDGLGNVIKTVSGVPEGEVRTVSATGGAKGVKLAAFDQVSPEVEMLVAEHFGKGARKYAAHNFRNGYEWSKSYSALRRHLADFWAGQEYDVCPADGKGCQIKHPETGEDTRVRTEHGWTCYNHTGSLHIVAVIWHAMVLTEFYLHRKEYDDRYVYPSD